ncbi:MAG: transposase, partial [Cyanobacteria bacterium P01_C01_bin.73]
AVFETWLAEQLLPALPYGSVIICDNASFHKGGRIEALIQQAGCSLLYLPPYSPDLNPIVGEAFPQGTSVVCLEESDAETDSVWPTVSASR